VKTTIYFKAQEASIYKVKTHALTANSIFLGSIVTFRTENIAAENPMFKATILRDM
jgi:hypothetical protein